MLAGELYRPDAELAADHTAANNGWRATTRRAHRPRPNCTRCSVSASARSAGMP
ncbi:hypothetical protein [Bradyrhizobium pachyrhizi]|uniref:hypothetical protein n=1 Tax=Bradyrhizobium pachyrhizi TaxID=280333 RepID=UPI003D323A5D